MKKLLILTLVLGLASVANAHLIFTVNGQPQDPKIDPPLYPSQTIELDLELSADETIHGYQLSYALSNPQAELLWDGVVFPWASAVPGKTLNTSPQYGEITATQFLMDEVQGPLVLMQGLIVHCLEATDVILEIYGEVTYVAGGDSIPIEPHTLLIPQIPEPMTIALLGLGGLLLRRRR
jgi:hypothetical protein